MDIFYSFLQLLGGLSIFIYGVELLSDGLEKVAGNRLLTFLQKAAGNAISRLLFGTVSVGLLQSSSMLMVTMIGLINAGMLSLEQAIGIMLGSEIGTTITGQLVAFNLKSIDLVFLVTGFYLTFFNKNRKLRTIGQPLFGVGLVFLGMKMMTGASGTISQMPIIRNWLEILCANVLTGVLAGAILTAVIQSSSAMTGLVIAMGSANSITLAAAISLILGANIGTCITGWIASLKSSLNAKRASYAQILINVGGVLLFLPFVAPFAELVANTSSSLPRQIANAHTVFNVIVSLVMLPLVKPLSRLIRKTFRGTATEERKKKTKYIDEQFLQSPFVAVAIAKAEVLRMGWHAYQMLKDAEKSFLLGKPKHATDVLKKEPDIDEIGRLVNHFMEEIPGDKLNSEERSLLEKLKHMVTDIERVGDHAVNLAEFAQQMDKKGIKITKFAHKELESLFSTVAENYSNALKAFKKNDLALKKQVIRNEDDVDKLEKKFMKNHIARLRKGLCQPEADPIFVETLQNLERISDHSYNIVLGIKSDKASP